MSSIKDLIGSNIQFSPIIQYIKEREIKLSIKILAIVISKAEIVKVAKKLLTKIKQKSRQYFSSLSISANKALKALFTSLSLLPLLFSLSLASVIYYI